MGKPPVGTKVRVFIAHEGKMKYIGVGTIVGYEDVYFEDLGVTVENIPKIQLGSGKILYGYECWWITLEEAKRAEKEVGITIVEARHRGREAG